MILLDSSALIAYANTRDAHHAAARSVMERLARGEWGTGLLLEYVFLETATVLAARCGLHAAIGAGEALLASRELEFVPSSALFPDAWEAFRQQDGSELSFTDAALVALARSRGVNRIATFDGDFKAVDGLVPVP